LSPRDPSRGAGTRKADPRWTLVACVLASSLSFVEGSVLSVALPAIRESYGAGAQQVQWVVNSYLLPLSALLLLGGALGDHFGRKRLLMVSVIGFTVASFFCGFATSLSMLVVFRIVQGACGGSLQPLSQAVLLEAFPAEKRGRAMGFWGLGIVVAPILGPALGGWLTDSYSWRWVFYINMPVGVAALIMIKAFVFAPSYIRRGEGRVDSWGIGLLAVSIGALQIVLDKGQQEDWFESRWIVGLLIVSIVTLVVFLFRELTIKYPVLDLHAFKDRTFSTGTFLMTVVGFVLYGSLVLLPIWLQTLLGYSSLDSGIAMAPRGIGAFCGMPLVGLFLAKYDPRKFLASGLLIAAVTLWSFPSLDLNAGYWNFFWPQFIQGISMALLFVPLTTISMSNIPKEQMGNATSIFNLLRNIGGSIGIACVATMTERFQQVHVNNLISHITPYGAQSRQMMEGMKQMMQSHGSPASTAARQSYIAMFGMVERQAGILAYTNTFRILAVIFLALIPLILIMKKPGKPAGPIVAH